MSRPRRVTPGGGEDSTRDESVNLYLIRHGETAHNRDGLGLGRDDVPLTLVGERQASVLGLRLADVPIDRVFSSPLGRARQTAEAVVGGRGIPIEIRDELIEMDVGKSDGLTIVEVQKRFPEFLDLWRSDDCAAVKMPGGESLADIAERIGPFLTELRETPDQAVAVVSHNFVLKVMLCRLLDLELSKFRGLTVDVASLTTVSLRDGRVNVRALNDSCHLVSLEP